VPQSPGVDGRRNPESEIPGIAVALRLIGWLLIAAATVITVADPDLWGHLRFGLDLLVTRRLPVTDPYSFTQDRPWINHEWLSELAMGLAFQSAGIWGLILLKALLVAATIWLIVGALREARPEVRWLSLSVTIWGGLAITAMIRPQLWTWLLLALCCRALTASSIRRIWLVPPLFLVWANVHGGWIVGLAMLACWVCVRACQDWKGNRPSAVGFAAVLALSTLATLINPYGWRLWQFLASTVGMAREDIIEWRPIWQQPPADTIAWTAAVLILIAGVVAKRRAVPYAAVAALAVMAYGSLRVSRVVPMFLEASVLLMAPALSRANEPKTASRTWSVHHLLEAVVMVLVMVFALRPESLRGCLQPPNHWPMPDGVARRALQTASNPGRLVTSFGWGQYAIWHLGPRLRVSLDGRRETVYSHETLAEQYAIASGTPAGLAALAKISPEYVWLQMPQSLTTKLWLAGHGYRIDVETPQSFVAVRSDLPEIHAPALPTSAAACFPNP
jgi:hypothetical protein